MLSRLLVDVSANVRTPRPRKHVETPHAFAAQTSIWTEDDPNEPRKHGTQFLPQYQEVILPPVPRQNNRQN